MQSDLPMVLPMPAQFKEGREVVSRPIQNEYWVDTARHEQYLHGRTWLGLSLSHV